VTGRYLIGAFGDPGHAFPAIALGRELVARGHEVCLETWSRWGEHARAEGMEFAAAADSREGLDPRRLKPYQAAVRGAPYTREVVRDFDPDLVIVDILTVAGVLAAELEDRPWVSLIPHLLPLQEPGSPPYSSGARPPRTPLGRVLWRPLDGLAAVGLRQGRDQMNGARARVGLPALELVHGGLSRRLSLVATFPQLEAARRSIPEWARLVGPLIWEQPAEEDASAAPPGEEPLVLVAPSTSKDPSHGLLRAALEGLADEPVRVLAATNGRPLPAGTRVPPNARLVEWPSYRRTMPACSSVVCHGGHGTVAQALVAGVPVVCSSAGGDMGENAARVAWAGVGVSLPPRFTRPWGVRLSVHRVLGDPGYAQRADELARWAARHPAGEAAEAALEEVRAGSGARAPDTSTGAPRVGSNPANHGA
jgi:UDP:flavonoid glycosyltransferase YjiC (YdhE family)